MPHGPVRIAALAALVLLAAPAAAQPPTMDALWPNDDGRSMSYDQHHESFDTDPQVVDNQIRLFFDGTTVAPNGIQAQYLRQQLVSGPAPVMTLGGSAGEMALASSASDPFLRRLWVARPDLRAKLLQRLEDSPCPQFAPPGAYTLLLGGEFAWLKTAGEIAAWRCNLADTRAWVWLVADLTIGNEFTLQLVPDLASDVFLHGTIAAIEPATVPAGTYAGCVRVDYVIDYGTSICTDPSGTSQGTFRSETRGYVRYAPGVGPVQSLEEFIGVAEATGNCFPPEEVGRVVARSTLDLNAQPVPVVPTSWGRIKEIYR